MQYMIIMLHNCLNVDNWKSIVNRVTTLLYIVCDFVQIPI